MPENIKCRDCTHLFDGGLGAYCCASLPAWIVDFRIKQAPVTRAYADTVRSCEAFAKKEESNG